MDANEAALNKYMENQEQEEIAYEQMLEELKGEPDPDNWDYIIESHGWEDADRIEILGDI